MKEIPIMPAVASVLLVGALLAAGCDGGTGADATVPDTPLDAANGEGGEQSPQDLGEGGVGGGSACHPAGPGQILEADRPGVQVFGTGHLGADSIRFAIADGVAVEFKSGTFLEPKPGDGDAEAKRPQRMMLAEDASLRGPGEFLIDANCMEANQSTPAEGIEFYSCAQGPSTSTQLCQRDCGDCQECVWACETDPTLASAAACEGVPETDDTFYVTDDCDDDYPLLYRFFDRTSGQVWPLDGGVFETSAVGQESHPYFTCIHGTRICLGGETKGGGQSLGVGLDGMLPESEDWCTTCGDGTVVGWTLSCD